MAMGEIVPDDVRALIEANTSLVPTQWKSPLAVADLAKLVPQARETVSPGQDFDPVLAKIMLGQVDDDTVTLIWKPRTKRDLGIRRTRFRDTFYAYVNMNKKAELRRCLVILHSQDYITMVNCLNAHLLLSQGDFSWIDFWKSLGAFNADVDHYAKVAKVVNDTVKKNPKTHFPWRSVVECGTMSGYRLPPFPGFDKLEEAKNLAAAGDADHGLDVQQGKNWLELFSAVAREYLDQPAAHPRTYQGFKEWVMQTENWETSGSSSRGRVLWEGFGEDGKFKARKNFVPEVENLEELAAEAASNRKQRNTTIIKSELGKLRLAVAGDLETYLQMAWIMALAAGFYLNWPGGTMEETLDQQTRRMIDMLDSLVNNFQLPFDYAGYDHQPTLDEVLIMVHQIIGAARKTVPAEGLAEFDSIASNVVEGFHNATLYVKDDQPTNGVVSGEEKELDVTGGVESGLRWTTALGNGWNTIMTGIVQLYLKILEVVTPVKRWIRGDDSAIYCANYGTTLFFRLLYEAIGAKGSDGKFGIHEGGVEFLRVWFQDGFASGYATRSIPNLLQKKPWNSDPWEEQQIMDAIYENIQTIKRRGANPAACDAYWLAVKQGWSRRNKTSYIVLQIPRALGGSGIEPWSGRFVLSHAVPSPPRRGISIVNMTEYRPARWLKRAAELGVKLDAARAVLLAQEDATRKIATDNVPEVVSVFRAQARQELKILPPTTRVEMLARINYTAYLGWQTRLQAKPQGVTPISDLIGMGQRGSFGSYRHLASDLDDQVRILDVKKIPYIRVKYPEWFGEITRLRKLGLKMSDAYDWTVGDLPAYSSGTVHPALSEVVKSMVVDQLLKQWPERRLNSFEFPQSVALHSAASADLVRTSWVQQHVYAW